MDMKVLISVIEIGCMLCISILCNQKLFKGMQEAFGNKNEKHKEKTFIAVSTLLDVIFLMMLVHFKSV